MIAFLQSSTLPQYRCLNLSSNLSEFVCRRDRIIFRTSTRRMVSRQITISATLDDQLTVMVNGVPGKMASATAEEVVRRGMRLASEALTGPGMQRSVLIDGTEVALSPPEDHMQCLQRVRDKYPKLIVVDYTHPSVANINVEKYTEEGLSFVIGTTGGDEEAMRNAVGAAEGVYAVIAPNMGKQVVAFQAMMETMAKEFPGAFDGYKLTLKESHQPNKADTSGTAKSVVGSFNKLGLDFGIDEIEKVRQEERSVHEMHVPQEYVTSGHAYHTYHLTSPDGTVNFEFQHNVCGRRFYAAGTVDAVQFLDGQRDRKETQRVFNMIDILRSGKMS